MILLPTDLRNRRWNLARGVRLSRPPCLSRPCRALLFLTARLGGSARPGRALLACLRPLRPCHACGALDMAAGDSRCDKLAILQRGLISAHSRLDSKRATAFAGTFHPCVASFAVVACEQFARASIRAENCNHAETQQGLSRFAVRPFARPPLVVDDRHGRHVRQRASASRTRRSRASSSRTPAASTRRRSSPT